MFNEIDRYQNPWPNINQCVLMVQSPTTLYCYWEMSLGKKSLIEHHLNTSWELLEKKIRIYDITDISFCGSNSNCYQDYSWKDESQQMFFYNLIPNRTYCVDIGVKTGKGKFFSLLRSNPIATPWVANFNVDPRIISKWKEGKRNEPEWVEGFSSYSYYDKNFKGLNHDE